MPFSLRWGRWIFWDGFAPSGPPYYRRCGWRTLPPVDVLDTLPLEKHAEENGRPNHDRKQDETHLLLLLFVKKHLKDIFSE